MDALLTKKIQEFGTLRGSVNRYMFVDLTAVMSAFSNDEKEAIYSFDLDEIKNEYVIRSFNRFKTLLESYLDIETDINDYDTLNRVYVLLFNKRFEIIAESLLNYIYNNKALIESRTMKEIESNLTNVAEDILRRNGYDDVTIQRSGAGTLSDNFDPRSKIVNLSDDVYDGNSIAAIAVAAHECGHVMQYQTGYAGIALRNAILPL